MKTVKHRVATDSETLKKFRDAGDDEQIVRLIDHSFTSENESSLAELSECLESMQFGNVALSQSEDTASYLLECTSIDCTEFHNIVKTSVLMDMLAQQFGVEYDGWGCSVVTSDDLV